MSTPSATECSPAPPSDSVSDELRFTRQLPLLLSAVAGSVDVLGYLSLKLFTAHITGNIVIVAALLVQGGPPTLDQALSIPIFMVAVTVVWLVAGASRRRGRALARPLLLVQLVLLSCAWLFCVLTHPELNPRGLAADVAAMIAISAMASQFALLQLAIPQAPSTAVMTGNVTKAVLGLLETRSAGEPLLVDAAGHLRRSLALIVVFVLSCMAGAGAFLWKGEWAWALPVALAAAALAVCPRSAGALGAR